MGSIRRELLAQVLVVGKRHLHRLLSSYIVYHYQELPHMGLGELTVLTVCVPASVLGEIHELE